MVTELILSILTLVTSVSCSIATIVVTFKIGKLNNLEAIHKYQKKITPFELTFKDKKWFLNLMKNDEFRDFDENSQTIIKAWWKKINQEEAAKDKETLKQLVQTTVKNSTGRTSRRNTPRVPTLPVTRELPVEVIVPRPDQSVGLRAVEELRNQYSVDEVEVETTNAGLELSFDDLLEASLSTKIEDK